MSLTPVGDLGIALKSDVDDFHKGMRTSKESVGLLTGSIRGLSAAMRNMGIAVTAASALAGAGMLTLARRAARVEEAFAEVDTISREVTNSQEEYGDLVSELNTEFGAHTNRLQTVSALYQSLSAGVDEGEESQREFLETATELSVVGLTDLGETVDVLSTVMNTYGEGTEFAERASEALFRTVQFGKVTLDELAPVMGRVSALASDLGVEIEETGSAMAVLTARGFEARVAATGLRNILRDMARPSEDLQEVLREIALDQDFFADSMGDSEEQVRDLANGYRQATNDLAEYEEKLQDARNEIDENSLVIQEARLLQEAIEEDRRSEAEETIQTQELIGMSYEELEDVVDDYQFQVNRARVEEEQHRQEVEELEEEAQDLKDTFFDEIDAAGDLEEGIGNLVLEHQDLDETILDIVEKTDEMGLSMAEAFPSIRSLNAILALTQDGGEGLSEVFAIMNDDVEDQEESIESLAESFDDMTEEDVRNTIEEMENMDEMHEDMADTSSAELRDAISELGEAAEELGEIFRSEAVESIGELTNFIGDLTDRIRGLDDTVQENIGRFSILAVAIGLVLGPMLFFAGQIALIGAAMGKMLLPALAVGAVLFGAFSAAMKTAIDGGDDAEDMFGSMEGVLSGMLDFLGHLYRSFRASILPALIELGEVGLDIFSEIAGELEELFGVGERGPSVFEEFSYVVRDLIVAFADFLDEHSEEIVEFVVKLANVILNDVIPALSDFASGAMAVIQDIDWRLLATIAGTILVAFGSILIDLIGITGRWMERNSELIGTLITVGVILGTVVAASAQLLVLIGKTAVAYGAIAGSLSTLIGVVKISVGVIGGLSGAMNIVLFIGRQLAMMFPMLAKGVSVVVKGLMLLGKGIAIVVGALSLKIVLIGALIAILLSFVAAVWIARDELVEAFWNAAETMAEIGDILTDWLFGDLDMREAGEKMMDALAEGFYDGLGHIEDAIGTVVDTVSAYLPSSPAEKGALSGDGAPGKRGEQAAEDFALGVEDGETLDMDEMVEDAEEFDVDSEFDIEGGDADIDSRGEEEFATGQETEITIEEGAIEVGPFEGISDEELPRKVGEEVDRSMDELVDELEAKGIEVR